MRSLLVLLLILSPLSASAKWFTYEKCTLDPAPHPWASLEFTSSDRRKLQRRTGFAPA